MRSHSPVATLFAVLLFVACDEPVKYPTAPLQVVAGSWVGEYRVDPDDIDCAGSDGSASATFEQDGMLVSGTLTAAPRKPCGFSEVGFQGSLVGQFLVGTGPDFLARGVLLSDGADLEIRILSGYYEVPRGVIHLHR